MAPSRRIHDLFDPAETVDRLRDKAAIPGGAGALDLALASTIARFGQHAAIGRRDRGVAEEPPRHWGRPARQVDRGRARPVAAKHVGDDADRLADAAGPPISGFRITDRPGA